MAKDRGDIVESVAPVEEPASEDALEPRERVTPVDPVVCTGVGIEFFTGSMDGQSVQVFAEDFGAEVCWAASQDIPDRFSRDRLCLIRLNASSILHRE